MHVTSACNVRVAFQSEPANLPRTYILHPLLLALSNCVRRLPCLGHVSHLPVLVPMALNCDHFAYCRHKLPRQLAERKLMCKDAGKPMTLLALLVQLAGLPTIVFAASVETTHRHLP